MIDKSKLKELALAATPGPWAAFTDDGSSHTNIVAFVPRTDCVFSLPGRSKREPNVEYLAAANPAAILELLAELESARNAALEEAAKVCEVECVHSTSSEAESYNLAIDHCAAAIRSLATTTSTEPAAPPAADVGGLTEARIAELNREAQDQGISGVAPSIYLARAVEREVLAAKAAQPTVIIREGAWEWEKRAETAATFMAQYIDANGEKLLGDYDAQSVIRRLAAAILEWQQDALKHSPEGVCTSPAPSAKQEPSTSEATKAQAQADLMPRREAFIKFLKARSLDEDEKVDAWGEREFKHSHIESMWFGWFNALESGAAPSASASPAAPAVPVPEEPPKLTADDVEWVVNDNAELGVKIGNQFFFLYKGDSLVYESGKHDDGAPMMWRPVGKREFGECCHPVKFYKDGASLPKRYTEELAYIPGLSFGEPGDCDWKPLPAAPSLQQGKEGAA